MKTRDQPPAVPADPGSPAGDPLQGLLERAHDDGFTAKEVEALVSRVALFVGAPTPGPGPNGGPAGSSSAAAGAMGFKTAVALVVGGLVAAGAVAHGWRSFEGSPQAPAAAVAPLQAPGAATSPSAASVPEPAASAASVPEPAVGRPEVAPISEGTRVSTARGAEAPSSPPSPASKAKTASEPERRKIALVDRATRSDASPAGPGSSPAAAAVPAGPGSSPAAAAVPAGPASSPAAATPPAPLPLASAGGDGATKATAASAAADPGPSEGTLLIEARQAQASDPATALALTQEHARRFPRGELVEEREVLAIEALAGLGRRSEARARLDAFRRRFPQSLHVARLERLLAK